jgi:hypothetical protein
MTDLVLVGQLEARTVVPRDVFRPHDVARLINAFFFAVI